MIVYDGGRAVHLNSNELHFQLMQLNTRNSMLNGVEEITDAMAQTIASWYHSPSSPNSTLLSTMGKVSDDMDLRDFVSHAEYMSSGGFDRLCLNYLESYITSKQDL